METLYDLLASLPAGASVVTAQTTYDADATRGTAFKTGNFLRTLGVREGVGVGVASTQEAKPVFAFLGAGLLGATVHFDPVTGDGLRAYVAPTDAVDTLDLPAGGQYVAWGEKPESPRIEYFERDVWSENPAFPPVEFEGDTPLLDAGAETYTHRDLLDAAESFADAHAGPVVLDADFNHPGTVVAALAALRGGRRLYLGTEPDDAAATVVSVSGQNAVDPRYVDI